MSKEMRVETCAKYSMFNQAVAVSIEINLLGCSTLHHLCHLDDHEQVDCRRCERKASNQTKMAKRRREWRKEGVISS